MTHLIFIVAAILAIGGTTAAVLTTEPRPGSVREALYLLVPVAGVLGLVVATAVRL